jgi:regulatory protein YycH of two-component signal transduction system YycFG
MAFKKVIEILDKYRYLYKSHLQGIYVVIIFTKKVPDSISIGDFLYDNI